MCKIEKDKEDEREDTTGLYRSHAGLVPCFFGNDTKLKDFAIYIQSN
jgi:hypothetical protein